MDKLEEKCMPDTCMGQCQGMNNRLEEIEKARKRGYYGEYSVEIDWLISEVRRLREEREELYAEQLKFPTLSEFSNLQDDKERLETQVKRLREAIEKIRFTLEYGEPNHRMAQIEEIIEKLL